MFKQDNLNHHLFRHIIGFFIRCTRCTVLCCSFTSSAGCGSGIGRIRISGFCGFRWRVTGIAGFCLLGARLIRLGFGLDGLITGSFCSIFAGIIRHCAGAGSIARIYFYGISIQNTVSI